VCESMEENEENKGERERRENEDKIINKIKL
jgi:hypothetical protein